MANTRGTPRSAGHWSFVVRFSRIGPCLSCLWVLFGLLTWVPTATASILSSESDHRTYGALVLGNGLRVVLVSDSTTDKAAASLDLDVGSGSDPNDREGLAHLLEHMLFLGTDRYPTAGEYQEFIRSRGGNHNAYTSVDHTNYYFDIEASHLAGALDRFARFFVAPTLDSQLIASERSVVHAEYSSKQEADGRRIWVARRQALDSAHPQAGFAVGSEETLADRPGDRVADDLQAFYLQHYHAGRMVLAVLGKEPLKDLEEMVRARFDEVPVGTSRALPDPVALYATDTVPVWQIVEPKKELRQLSFIFPVPSIRKLYATKPLSYVANLLGHEGPGSLFTVLKAKGWAENLSAGSGMVRDVEGTFEISIGLTPTGLDHIESIGEMVFDAIRRVRDHGIDGWRYAEQKQLAKMQFRFQEAVEPITLTRALAARWHEYPLEDLLYANYRYDELVKTQVIDYLSRMTPENLHLLLVAPGQETDQVDRWYGVRYRLTKLPEAWTAAWRVPPHVTALSLPVMNPFVPNDFSLRESPDTTPHPVRIVIEPGFDLWFDHDLGFGLPHSSLYFSVRSPQARGNARQSVLTELYIALVNDTLSELTYPAFLAGVDFKLYAHRRGFSLRIEGFNDRQAQLLEAILQGLAEPVIEPARFERLREDLLIRLRNRQRGDPSHRAMGVLHRLLLERSWPPAELVTVAKAITIEEMKVFPDRFFSETNAVMLAHGNISRPEARAVARQFSSRLLAAGKRVDVPRNRVVRLDGNGGLTRLMSLDHRDAVAVRYRQGADRSVAERARLLMLGQVIGSAFYDRLRTQQKLGYVVFSTAMPLMEVPGMVFVVQSPNHEPAAIQMAIDEFLADFMEEFEGISPGEFEQHRQGLLSQLLRSDQQLTERSDYYWRELDREAYRFDTRSRLAGAIRAVTPADLAKVLRAMREDEGAREIRVNAYGSGHSRPTTVAREIKDAVSFRQNLSWYEVNSQ